MVRSTHSGSRSNTRKLAGLALWLAVLATPALLTPAMAQLPDGVGKAETEAICKQCHELERSISIRQDRAGWQTTMDKMAALGAQGTQKQFDLVVDYLAAHFAADEVPRIKVNEARAIELESGLSLPRSQATALVEYREKHGPFHSIEDLKKVPGVDAAKIEAKKDRLAF